MSTELPKNKPEKNLFELEDLYTASEKAKERAQQKEDAPRRKLFLSVEGLMIDMLPKKISEDGPMVQVIKKEDLNTGLFYFGCTRDEFFNFEKGGPIADQLKFFGSKGLTNFRIIENAVEKAEKEGRVLWREKREQKEGHSYADLNVLLSKNGLKNIEPVPDQNRNAYFEDADKDLKDLIKELGLALAANQNKNSDFGDEVKDQIEKLGLPLDVVR